MLAHERIIAYGGKKEGKKKRGKLDENPANFKQGKQKENDTESRGRELLWW